MKDVEAMYIRKGTVLAILGSLILLSLSSNPPQGNTGAPFEGSCNRFGCHFTQGVIEGTITLSGIPDEVIPGNSYNYLVQIEATVGTPIRGGMQMIAVNSDNLDSGILSNPGSNSTLSTFDDRTYFEHQPAQFFGDADRIEYSGTWTAPTEFGYNGETTFYVASILSNGSNDPNGDTFLKTSIIKTLKKDSIEVIDCENELILSSPGSDVSPGKHISLISNRSIISSSIVDKFGGLAISSSQEVVFQENFKVSTDATLDVFLKGCENENQ